jgi:hypothetical protein
MPHLIDHIIESISRKWGMVVSFTILALLGLLFLVPKIKNSLVITTLVLGVSRIASSDFFLIQTLHIPY